MINCQFCNKVSCSTISYIQHLRMAHNIKEQSDRRELLYNIRPDLFSPCQICNCKTLILQTDSGRRTCSEECSAIARSSGNKGRKQTEEQIRNRVNNTNQKNKEQTRQNTMNSRYGSLCVHREDTASKIGNSLKGRTRSKEHQQNIIESKRKNGNLTHNQTTKDKIKSQLEKYYQDGEEQSVNIGSPASNGKGHMVGTIDGYSYRSSYELSFIIFCLSNNIKLLSGESKEHRIRYSLNEKKHWYYPDFYLPKFDLLIEIKPRNALLFPINTVKFKAASQGHNFVVLCEEVLDHEFLGVLMNEYILPGYSSNFSRQDALQPTPN